MQAVVVDVLSAVVCFTLDQVGIQRLRMTF